MIYHANPCTDELRDHMIAGRLGCITTPEQGNVVFPAEVETIADNGCFITPEAWKAGRRWDERKWRLWLIDQPRSFRFAVCPDVFYPDGLPCHDETMDRWVHYGGMMARHGFTPAFVVQVGCTPDSLPHDADVIFIGGDDGFKLSGDVKRICERAKSEGRWVHWGRVNSEKRMLDALESGADSCDGTYVVFGPDTNTPKLLRKLERAHNKYAARLSVPGDIGVGTPGHRPPPRPAPSPRKTDASAEVLSLFEVSA